jgi:hypothetical protein
MWFLAVSAAEILSREVFNGWKTLRGPKIVERLGSTEVLHIRKRTSDLRVVVFFLIGGRFSPQSVRLWLRFASLFFYGRASVEARKRPTAVVEVDVAAERNSRLVDDDIL